MGLPHHETRPADFRSDAERKAYARGTQIGARWPAHKPPLPPEGIVRDLMSAAQSLRDAADTVCATLDPKDEFVQRLGPGIDAVDWAMSALTDWLKSNNETKGGKEK